MSWFGKMLGGTVGLLMGGPLGAIAGAAIGHHLFDKDAVSDGPYFERGSWQQDQAAGGRGRSGGAGGMRAAEQRQMGFFLALFSILGKLAKADGQITREEGEKVVSFLDRMGVQGEMRRFAIRVFNEAKSAEYSAADFARQFAELSHGRHDLRASMIDMLFQVALADGEFHPAEERLIGEVAGILGISDTELTAIRRRYVDEADRAYAVLGLSPSASDDEVKQAYRRLVRENHPDRITSQGMPDEFAEYATERFQKIQDAWETIRRERGL